MISVPRKIIVRITAAGIMCGLRIKVNARRDSTGHIDSNEKPAG